jgi:hypothetical protein
MDDFGKLFFFQDRICAKMYNFKMDKNPPTKHPILKVRRFHLWTSLGHHGRVFVGEINKFVDSAKGRLTEILAFKLDYSLSSAFLHWHFSFLTFVLMDFWWTNLMLPRSACFYLQFRHNALSIHLNSWSLEVLILSFLTFFFCIWGCIPLYPPVKKSEEVCDSIWVIIMNMYYS